MKTEEHTHGKSVLVLAMMSWEQGLSVQATSVQKDQSIRQLNAKISQAERDLKRAQDKFQEEKVLLTNRETELLKARADVGIHQSF